MHPIYAPVAQTVEHLTFNQGVRSSNLRRSTNKKATHTGGFFVGAPFAEGENSWVAKQPGERLELACTFFAKMCVGN